MLLGPAKQTADEEERVDGHKKATRPWKIENFLYLYRDMCIYTNELQWDNPPAER